MHFKALKSALIESSKEPKRHISDALDDALAQRIMEELVKDNSIEHLGGKRYRHWQIMK